MYGRMFVGGSVCVRVCVCPNPLFFPIWTHQGLCRGRRPAAECFDALGRGVLAAARASLLQP